MFRCGDDKLDETDNEGNIEPFHFLLTELPIRLPHQSRAYTASSHTQQLESQNAYFHACVDVQVLEMK